MLQHKEFDGAKAIVANAPHMTRCRLKMVTKFISKISERKKLYNAKKLFLETICSCRTLRTWATYYRVSKLVYKNEFFNSDLAFEDLHAIKNISCFMYIRIHVNSKSVQRIGIPRIKKN